MRLAKHFHFTTNAVRVGDFFKLCEYGGPKIRAMGANGALSAERLRSRLLLHVVGGRGAASLSERTVELE